MKLPALCIVLFAGLAAWPVCGGEPAAVRAAHEEAFRAIERSDWEAARSAAEKARRLYSRGDDAHPGLLAAIENRLGLALLHLRVFNAAERSFRRALEILETKPDTEGIKGKALANLGQCLARNERPAEALPVLRKAHAELPADSPLRWDALFDALDAARAASRPEAAAEFIELLRKEIAARTGEADRADRLTARLHLIDAALDAGDADLVERELAAASREAGKEPDSEVRAAFALTTALVRFMRNELASAIKHIQDFVRATGKKYGERSIEYTGAVERYADFFERTGKPAMAEPMLLLAASLAVDRLAANSVDEFRKAIERLARFYEANGEPRLRKAISFLQAVTYPKIEGLGEAIEELRPDLTAMDGSGRILQEVRTLFADANVQSDEARRILASQGFAMLLFNRRLIGEARVHFERVIRYAESHGAPRYGVFVRNNLLATYIAEGKLSDAEKLALEAVKQIERFDGKRSALLESFLHNLLGIEQRRENLPGAVQWADRLLEVAEAAHGKNAAKYWNALFHRADVAAAANLPDGLKQLQTVCEQLPMVVEKVRSADELAMLKDPVIYACLTMPMLGEPAAGIALAEKFAKRLAELAPPEKNPGMAEYLLMLHSMPAMQLRQLGAIDRAAELVGAAYRAMAVTPLSSSESLKNFWNLAVDLSIDQLLETGLDGAHREALLQEATKWHEEQLRRFRLESMPASETTITKAMRDDEKAELTFTGVRLAFARGDLEAARRDLAEVKVTDKNRVEHALISGQLAMAAGRFKEAEATLRGANLAQPWNDLRREFYGRVLPKDYFRTLLVLCEALRKNGKATELRKWVEHARSIYREHFRELRAQWPPEVILSANMFRELAGIAAASDDPAAIAEILARHKGEAGDGAHMSQRPLVKQLRLEMGRLLQQLPTDPAQWTASHRAAELQISNLERSIETALATRETGAPSADFARVQASLQEGRVLADYVQFHAVGAQGQIESRYGVLIARHGQDPLWRVLREGDAPISARALDALVEDVRHLIEKPPKDDSEDRILAGLARLHAIVWQPVAEVIDVSKVTEVLIVPDGALSEVPFAALRGGERGQRHFLCEEPFAARFLGSMRDLLASFQRVRGGGILCIAAPTLTLPAGAKPARSYQRDEAEMLHARAKSLGFSVLEPMLIGDDATELSAQTRMEKNDAAILHFAAHGYGRSIGRNAFQDFAGYGGICLRPSSSAKHNIFRDGDSLTPQDGSLGWREIACLKLDHAWLAVLSSCSTALGTRRAGEGVLGMRWGFRQAGVPAQLLTLWDIDDSPDTVAFMQAFYEALAVADQDVRTASWRLQKRLLPIAARRSAQDAIRLYGGFVLYSVGR